MNIEPVVMLKERVRRETLEEVLAECEKAKRKAIGWNIPFMNGFERCINVVKGLK